MNYSVSISFAPGEYVRTKIILIAPMYIFVNTTPFVFAVACTALDSV